MLGRWPPTSAPSCSAQYLLERGFTVDSVPDNFSNPCKLLARRIDLWVTSIPLASEVLEHEGLTGKIVPLLTFQNSGAYLACNKTVPAATIAAMDAAFADCLSVHPVPFPGVLVQ